MQAPKNSMAGIGGEEVEPPRIIGEESAARGARKKRNRRYEEIAGATQSRAQPMFSSMCFRFEGNSGMDGKDQLLDPPPA